MKIISKHIDINKVSERKIEFNLMSLDGHLKIPHLWPGQNPPATGQFQFTNLL